MEYRSMVLCFLKFRVPRFTPFDAHYFPDSDILFSRISERKNYDGGETPEDSTGLCVEIHAGRAIPCGKWMTGSSLRQSSQNWKGRD